MLFYVFNFGVVDKGVSLTPTYPQLCHTLISSGEHCLVACNLRLTTSRYLTPIVRQSVKFHDMPEVERKHCCAIRKVPQHAGNRKEALLHNL